MTKGETFALLLGSVTLNFALWAFLIGKGKDLAPFSFLAATMVVIPLDWTISRIRNSK